MKLFVDLCIGIGRICAGVLLIAGMMRFGMVQSEPPRPEDARVGSVAAPSAPQPKPPSPSATP